MKHKTAPGVHHTRVTARVEHIHKRHHELHASHVQAAAAAAGVDPATIDANVHALEAENKP